MRRSESTGTHGGLGRDGRNRDGAERLREATGTPPGPTGARKRTAFVAAGGLALAIVGWALLTLLVEDLGFAILAPRAQAGVEAAAALARLFGALVLGLFFAQGLGGGGGEGGRRLPWVAGGLLVQALGSLAFGSLEALLGDISDLNTAAYESLVVWSVAGALFAVGLVPKEPPRLGWVLFGVSLLVFGASGVAAYEEGYTLPALVLVYSPEAAVALGSDLPGVTAPYWVLSAVPLCLTVAATVGAALGHRRGALPGWLLLAMVLFAGAQVHNLFWPSAYSPILASADVLRLASAAAIAVGAVLELRGAASERAALLAEEKDRTRRLGELAALKADFTAMVAHELVSPLCAVRRFADALVLGGSDPELRGRAAGAIRKETAALEALVADVRAAAVVEREDFEVNPRPVPLLALLEDARARAKALPGDHPVDVSFGTATGARETVLADRERIGQVLRNLLSNAAGHSPEGAPIELRVVDGHGRVRIEVVDHGAGVHPDDLDRIFEKFGRGRDADANGVSGAGLGLYICRRVLLCHGSELSVRSVLGKGSVFSFELEVAEGTGEEDVAR